MTALLQPIPVPAAIMPDAAPVAGSRYLRFGEALRRVPGEPLERILPQGADLARLRDVRAGILGIAPDGPALMGILNVTPDSFSDGGTAEGVQAAVARARAMAPDVAILDIGGESTRPGAAEVSVDEEIRRTAPVIAAIRDAGLMVPISIDTRKARVARAALDAGADMVNDVTALRFDPEMAAVVAEAGCPVCLMHSTGTPETMQNDPRYADVLHEVAAHLRERVAMAEEAGIARANIVVDPGIGFGKTMAHNLTLLKHLAAFHDLGAQLLVGASRKAFIGTLSGVEAASERVAGSLSVALHAASQGVQLIRVHDTQMTRQALDLWRAQNEV